MINRLLTDNPSTAPIESAASWKQWYLDSRRNQGRIDLAILGGFNSANVASAFYSGYQMAIRELLGRDAEGGLAFCVSEEKGNHPKIIEATLHSDNTVSGAKKYVAGASEADLLVVIVRLEGERDLRAVIIDAHQGSITVEKLEGLDILPEVPHGKASFNKTKVVEVLAGDGHGDYSRRFRSIEDIYVSASMLGFLARVARNYDWPREALQRVLLLVQVIKGFCSYDPLDPALHVLLGAFNQEMAQLLHESGEYWATVPEELQAIWQRDKAIITVAAGAKQARLDKAWQEFDNQS